MKRRQFLKMIPIGVLSAFIPVKSEPIYITKAADICRGPSVFDNTPIMITNLEQAAELYGDGSQIARMIGETDIELKERVLYKIKEPVTYV